MKDVLEGLYARYNHRDFVKSDPLQFVYRYSEPADMEIAGFLAAELAYGRVQQIEKAINDLLGRMGESPFRFVRNFDERKRRKLKDFKYRFISGDDISDLLVLLKNVLSRYGGIRGFFMQGYNRNDKDVVPAVSRFCDSLLDMYAGTQNDCVPKGLRYLLPRPAAGGACKRLNLFLRWMVRNDEVDAGLWNSIDKAKLIVPVDVHMARLCRILGFYSRKTVSLSTAIEITEGFRGLEPADPVKYDFALSRLGILKNCTGRTNKRCEDCELLGFCDGMASPEGQAKDGCRQ
jgi:uncharacterized protein (TIGR02757 family)